jgi:hypothetical protein
MTERVLGPTGSRRRRRRLLTSTALIGALLTIFFVAASGATLTGSTFNTGNGSLTDLNANDWNPVNQPAGNDGPVETITCPNSIPGSGTNCGLDLVNNAADNAYGQGAKEDDPSPSVVTGSIPPNKDDLSRFYVNKQRASSKDFLYLAWERSNLLGSAHMDFEFNQKFCDLSKTPTNCAANSVNPLRSAGDLLIDFDFGGSGPVGLFLHKWITTGAASNCEASNSLPCWDKAVTLTNAEASVNSVDVTDNNPPGNPRNLDGETKQTGGSTTVSSEFGEAGINLTDSGVFPQNVCVNFGSASLKSRSAGSSFTSELKDFIAPIPVNISNCGSIKIIKRTAPTRGINKDFSFTSNIPDPATGSTQPTCTTDTTPSSFTLNDNGNTTTDSTGNTESCVNVIAASYHVNEGTNPAGWTLKSLVCTTTGTGGSTGTVDATDDHQANIVLKAGDLVTCVYTNEQQLGAIKITKKSSKTAATGLAGAEFTIGGGVGVKTTDSNGEICVDGLAFATYSVQETKGPAGYKIDDTTSHNVVVDNNAKCSDSPFVGETFNATDTPLTDITVEAKSQASGGTKSQITCKGPSPATTDIGDSPSGNVEDAKVSATGTSGVLPGTYTCTIVVDP